MIIAKIYGGLGNQMFQYAAARSLAERRRTELKLDLTWFDGSQRQEEFENHRRSFKLKHFNISAKRCTEQEAERFRDRVTSTSTLTGKIVWRIRQHRPWFLRRYVPERTINFDPRVMRAPNNIMLDGYWQSEKYFQDVEEVIRREFTFAHPKPMEWAKRYLDSVRRNGKQVVAVHVRRGDLAHACETLRRPELVYGPPVTVQYLREATRSFGDGCQFVIVSDDTAWCKRNLQGAGVYYAPGESDLEDFALIQQCDHAIISNSTFGWWAAWLNRNARKQVVAPRNWFHQTLYMGHQSRDLIPEYWELA